jgi:PAS domain-containing protein
VTTKSIADADVDIDVRRTEALLQAGALQSAIFNSAKFSSIATDAKGVIQIFNVGAERMRGYSATDVTNKITSGEVTLRLAREIIPDFNLLHVDVPSRSGFDGCETLKADPTLACVAPSG